jgi:hypothetical protein
MYFTFFFELRAADGCAAVVVANVDVVGGWIWQLMWLHQLYLDVAGGE